MKQLSKETLQGMNKKQLYDYCRANGIKGYSNQNKAYINNLILNFYKSGVKLKKPAKKCKMCKKDKEIADDGLCYSCYDKQFWKRGELKHKKLTDIGVKWKDTDELIKQIKIGKKIDYQDFDEIGYQKYFEGTISRINKKTGEIYVKRGNKDVNVEFRFYEKENGKVKLTFSSAKVFGYSKSFMRMIKKSDKGKGAFGR